MNASNLLTLSTQVRAKTLYSAQDLSFMQKSLSPQQHCAARVFASESEVTVFSKKLARGFARQIPRWDFDRASAEVLAAGIGWTDKFIFSR